MFITHNIVKSQLPKRTLATTDPERLANYLFSVDRLISDSFVIILVFTLVFIFHTMNINIICNDMHAYICIICGIVYVF